MLTLKNITKNYLSGDSTVHALKGVDLEFGKSEFVSILGPSGCGKTTLLNIIGGLDRYTDGDLYIRGKSTKDFTDGDWDSYRNHTIGFVFQTYNLIPHQTVLANVELALTLSGIGKAERREKAVAALERVGLGDQLKKKPNQLSGGQMQRVAIARAIVNDPDIILADEPTGALDSETSVQVMEILREISKEKLIIMVTHNPELAEKYSSRIIRVLDGKVIGDEQKTVEKKREMVVEPKGKKEKKPSMSFFTAVSLSFRNLLTKKGRTFLTSFAGSIGIIGIALILALSNGIQLYINRVQEDTLSSYPLQIQEQAIDLSGLMMSMTGKSKEDRHHELDAVYSNTMAAEFINTMMSQVKTNNLKSFKSFIESDESGMAEFVSSYQYIYNITPNIYTKFKDAKTGEEKLICVNPSSLMSELYGDMGETMTEAYAASANSSLWSELIDDKELLESQYELIGEGSHWPTAPNEIVLIVNERNEINDMVLYALGIKDPSEMSEIIKATMLGEQIDVEPVVLQYDEVLNMTFRLVLNSDYFVKDRMAGDFQVWKDASSDPAHLEKIVYGENAITLKICGIIRPAEDAVATSASGAIGYLSDLTKELVNRVNSSEIAIQQRANPEINVLTGMPFNTGKEITMDDINAYLATLPAEEYEMISAYTSQMTEEQIVEMFASRLAPDATYESVCRDIGIVDLDKPAGINIFAQTFDAKEHIVSIIDSYNTVHEDDGNKIVYTDVAGILMSSVSTIINFVSYALIAFVSISLVVSSIMIGIITYISVLERTKEIGVLRAIGASKRDISRVFNAETMIVGFGAGLIGILATLLIILPINLILEYLTDINNIAVLPWQGALILIAISVFLTFIAGLIPARIAAKKDPVVALRTE